jgi:hypothetical protein
MPGIKLSNQSSHIQKQRRSKRHFLIASVKALGIFVEAPSAIQISRDIIDFKPERSGEQSLIAQEPIFFNVIRPTSSLSSQKGTLSFDTPLDSLTLESLMR